MEKNTATQTDMTYFWKKREIVSYILSILVFLVHITTFANYPGTGTAVSAVNESARIIVTECFTRFAVPLYFIISGALFFRNYKSNDYTKKLKSRAKTLLVPYLLWNTLWMLFSIAISYTFISNYFIGRQKFVISVGNILQSIFFYESNKPFWFIFNLIIFVVATPLFDLVTRNKYVGIVVVVALPALGALGIEIPANIFYYTQSVTFYLIGCLIGRHYLDYFCKKVSKPKQLVSGIFLVMMAFFLYAQQKGYVRVPFYEINDVLFIFSAWAFWNFADLFVDKLRPRHCYKTSFAVFAMHTNVLAIITKLIYLIFPQKEIFAIPNLILTIILTLVSINIFCIILEKISPKLYGILMGNR